MAKLLPGLKRENQEHSGISHHMLFTLKYLSGLFSQVEKIHSKPFWKAFLEMVDPYHHHGSGASEYEIYFNYLLKHYSDKVIIRKLSWANINRIDLGANRDYISCHSYLRSNELEKERKEI